MGQPPQFGNLEDFRFGARGVALLEGRSQAHYRAILAEIQHCGWRPGGPPLICVAAFQEWGSVRRGYVRAECGVQAALTRETAPAKHWFWRGPRPAA